MIYMYMIVCGFYDSNEWQMATDYNMFGAEIDATIHTFKNYPNDSVEDKYFVFTHFIRLSNVN